MEIEIIELSDQKAKFLLSGVSPAFANGLRRNMLSEIPIMAIDHINVYDNTSVLFDEQLALRLGLIPIKTDLDSYTLPKECSCKGAGCPQCQLSLTLSAAGPKMVYSGDLVSTDPKVGPADPKIPIIELKDHQKVVLEAIACLGFGKDHAKWQAAVACGYKNLPIITIKECDACGECIEFCPRGVLKITNNNLKVVDILGCSLCRQCETACDMGAIEVREDPTSFIFSLESSGSIPAPQIIIEAAKGMKKRANQLRETLTSLG